MAEKKCNKCEFITNLKGLSSHKCKKCDQCDGWIKEKIRGRYKTNFCSKQCYKLFFQQEKSNKTKFIIFCYSVLYYIIWEDKINKNWNMII